MGIVGLRQHVFSVAFVLMAAAMGGSLAFLPPRVAADRVVAGPITADTVWTLLDSPIWIEGNVWVEAGVTLAIEPGVEVRFNGPFSLEVNGTLVAQGLPGAPIRFTSNATAPAIGDWDRIGIAGDASVLANVNVTFGSGCLWIAGDGHTITNAEIAHCATGIRVSGTRNVFEGVDFLDFPAGVLNVQGSYNVLANGTMESSTLGVAVTGTGNRVEGNTFEAVDEAVSLSAAFDTVVRANVICCRLSASFGSGNVFEGNQVQSSVSPSRITGGQAFLLGNDIGNLELSDADVSALGNRFGVVNARNSTFDGTNDTFAGTPEQFNLDQGSHATFLNATLDAAKVFLVDDASSFVLRWFLDVFVENRQAYPVAGATARVRDALGTEVFNGTADGLTGADGHVAWIPIVQYERWRLAQTDHTPHIVRAFLFGPDEGSTVLNADASKTATVILNNDIDPPLITNVSAVPNPQVQHGAVNVSASVVDAGPFQVFLNVTYPDGSWLNQSMVGGSGDVYFLNRTYDQIGTHDFLIAAIDEFGNAGKASGSFAVVPTNEPPVISNATATPDPQDAFAPVRIAATIRDADGIANATVRVRDPEGRVDTFPLGAGANDTYSFEGAYNKLGAYTFNISARDGHPSMPMSASAVGGFVIVDRTPPLLVNVTVTPDPVEYQSPVAIAVEVIEPFFLYQVILEVRDPSGTSLGTFAMSSAGGNTYGKSVTPIVVGRHTFTINAVDGSSNLGTTIGSFLVRDSVAPLADAGPDRTVPQGVPVTFDGSGSTDNDGIDNYTWEVPLPGGSVFLYGVAPTRAFQDVGVFVVTLTVRDVAGNEDTDATNLTVVDGVPPEIRNVTAAPSPAEAPALANVSFALWDSSALAAVGVAAYGPDGNLVENDTADFDANASRYYREQLLVDLGTYRFVIWAQDAVGNWNSTEVSILAQDTTFPEIDSASAAPSSVQVKTPTTLSAAVTDAYLVGVAVEVRDPSGGLAASLVMFLNPGPKRYEATYAPVSLGTYTFTIRAADEGGNVAVETGSFLSLDLLSPSLSGLVVDPQPQSIGGTVDVSVTAMDDYALDFVRIEIEDPSGTPMGTFAMLYGTGDGRWHDVRAYPSPGVYTFVIRAADETGNEATLDGQTVIADLEPPTISGVTKEPESWEVGGTISVSATVRDNIGLQRVSLQVTDPQGAGAGNHTMACDAEDRCAFARPFALVGTYAFRIWATDMSGNVAMAFGTLDIVEGLAPTARAGADRSVEVGSSVAFDGSGSTDDFGIVAYRWTFTYRGHTETLTGPNASFRFEDSGTYEVTLTVEDAAARTSTDTLVVNVFKPFSFLSPTFLILLLASTIVAAALLGYLAVRRRRPRRPAPRPRAAAPKAKVKGEEIEKGIAELDEEL